MPEKIQIRTDVVVIGGGIAGCMAAIEARKKGVEVVIVDKTYSGYSGASITPPAGMFCFDPAWGISKETMMENFIIDGEYIANRDWVSVIIDESLQVHKDWIAYGVEFPELTPELAKSVGPPYTNTPIPYRGFSPLLRKQAVKVGTKMYDHITCVDLIKEGDRVVGVYGFNTDTGDFYTFIGSAVVMAGGGTGFKPAGMPIGMLSGDAEAMAFRAGASLTGKEFCNTPHPTRVDYPSSQFAMLSAGFSWTPFNDFEDAFGELHGWADTPNNAEPDLISYFLAHEGRGPLKVKKPEATKEEQERIEWMFQENTPYERTYQIAGGSGTGYGNVGTCGIWVYDTDCNTDLKGFFAAGDCAGTRHNGALLVNVGGGTGCVSVVGKVTGAKAAEFAQMNPYHGSKEIDPKWLESTYRGLGKINGFSPRWVAEQLQNVVLPYYALYVKSGDRLQAQLTIVEFIRDHLVPMMYVKDYHELRLLHETTNMVLTAEMMLKASLFRTESRGIHYREDYPDRNDEEWLAWTKVLSTEEGMSLEKVMIPEEWRDHLHIPYEKRYPKRFPNETRQKEEAV